MGGPLGRCNYLGVFILDDWESVGRGEGGGSWVPRLAANAVQHTHAVSERFVACPTPRSKLEHMGKETVRKLADLRAAASAAGMDISIPENCVLKVGVFLGGIVHL